MSDKNKQLNTLNRSIKSSRLWIKSCIIACLFVSNTSSSEGILPSHVYQASSRIVATLVKMNHANKTLPKKYETTVSNRKPRHVYEKATELFFRVQTQRELLKLPRSPLPEFPKQAVQAKHVYTLVNLTLRDLTELAKKYNDDISIQPSPYEAEKTPTNVYQKLHSAVYLIDALVSDPTTPSNVYQLASIALNDINSINRKFEIIESTPQNIESGASIKHPSDVFEKTRDALQWLQVLCDRKKEYCIPGGVIVPDSRTWWRELLSKTEPKHVFDLMNNLVADIKALKQQVGLPNTALTPEFVVGKQPKDVYKVVSMIEQKIKDLSLAW